VTDGFLNIYKEQGFTSFDVVAKLRGIFGQKKIGHTGTLDPMAEGVLPVALGRAAKLTELLIEKDKTYEAVMLLGTVTDTEDVTGKVLRKTSLSDSVTPERVSETGKTFLGKSLQLPPMYAAIRKDGKHLYEYARAGITVEREKRPIEIYELEILDIRLPEVSFRVRCSKGTYIRSLCRDWGEMLGCGGTMKALKRTKVLSFTAEDAVRLSELQVMKEEGRIAEAVLPMDVFFPTAPVAKVTEVGEKRLRNGNPLKKEELLFAGADSPETAAFVKVYEKESLRAFYRYSAEKGVYMPYKML